MDEEDARVQACRSSVRDEDDEAAVDQKTQEYVQNLVNVVRRPGARLRYFPVVVSGN